MLGSTGFDRGSFIWIGCIGVDPVENSTGLIGNDLEKSVPKPDKNPGPSWSEVHVARSHVNTRPTRPTKAPLWDTRAIAGHCGTLMLSKQWATLEPNGRHLSQLDLVLSVFSSLLLSCLVLSCLV